MNESFVSLAFLVGVPAIIVALVVVTRGRGRRPAPRVKTPAEVFRDGFDTDPDYVYGDNTGPRGHKSGISAWQVTSRRGQPQLTLVAREVDHPGPLWEITAIGTASAGPVAVDVGVDAINHLLRYRTGLVCEREGVIGLVENALGHKDVETGDAAFDALVCITGRERDVVRAVVRQPTVLAALQAIMAGEPPGRRCEVDHRGVLVVSIYRAHLSSDEARTCLEKVRALFIALEAASAVEPLPLVEPSEVGSVASSSGAPVGFGGSV